MVKSTLKRLTKIYDSIKVNGYNPRIEKNIKDTFPSGQVLLSDSKGEETPFFLLKSGHHRLAALAALGYETVPICFRPGMPPVVREEEVEHWPQVKNKSVSKDEALLIFHCLLNGKNQKIERWKNEFFREDRGL